MDLTERADLLVWTDLMVRMVLQEVRDPVGQMVVVEHLVLLAPMAVMDLRVAVDLPVQVVMGLMEAPVRVDRQGAMGRVEPQAAEDRLEVQERPGQGEAAVHQEAAERMAAQDHRVVLERQVLGEIMGRVDLLEHQEHLHLVRMAPVALVEVAVRPLQLEAVGQVVHLVAEVMLDLMVAMEHLGVPVRREAMVRQDHPGQADQVGPAEAQEALVVQGPRALKAIRAQAVLPVQVAPVVQQDHQARLEHQE
jgi:hypothetical protein